MNKHTPLPWSYERNEEADAHFERQCWEVGSYGSDTGIAIVVASEANAAYIVQCCNAYDKLVEALKCAREALKLAETQLGGQAQCKHGSLVGFMTDALRAAGEEL